MEEDGSERREEEVGGVVDEPVPAAPVEEREEDNVELDLGSSEGETVSGDGFEGSGEYSRTTWPDDDDDNLAPMDTDEEEEHRRRWERVRPPTPGSGASSSRTPFVKRDRNKVYKRYAGVCLLWFPVEKEEDF